MTKEIKYKYSDRQKWNDLIHAYYDAILIFFSSLFCDEFLPLHRAISAVAKEHSVNVDDYFTSRMEDATIVRYVRIMSLSQRNAIRSAWIDFFAWVPEESRDNGKIRKLDAIIMSLDDDVIEW